MRSVHRADHHFLRLLDCGDIEDVAKNNGVWAAEADCDTPCPGDPIHICGSGNRLTTYFWDGVMNEWKTPAVTGRYEVRNPWAISAHSMKPDVLTLSRHSSSVSDTRCPWWS